MQAGKRSGHRLMVAVLMVSLTDSAWAASATPQMPVPIPVETSQELELLKEEETVSIASRYEQPISQAPSNVFVITDEDIRHSGATDIPTILRRIPGIEVMQMSGADFNVSVRGDNQVFSNKMLVMVDGRSIYVDVQGTVFWKALPVTLPEIKRIEVLKGPASAIYGFNAFDGVINIITKSPEEMKGTTLQFGGGELGTISSAAVQAGTSGRFGYRFSIGHDQNQQWRNQESLAFRSDKINLQTEYTFSDEAKLSLSGGLIDVNRFDGGIGGVNSLSTPFQQGYANALYQRRNFFVRAWWSQWNTQADFDIVPSLASFLSLTDKDGNSKGVRFMGNSYNVEAQHTIELTTNYLLSYGINYRRNTLEGRSLIAYSHEDRLGLYIQNELKLNQHFTVSAGVRYDLHTEIPGTISPRIALIYSLTPEHTFRGSVSVAYRPPTLFETNSFTRSVITLPAPFPNPSPTDNLGNSNRGPEQIISYEVGYQGWYLKHRVRLRADIFLNHISDLLVVGQDSGSADIYGGEAGVEFLATKWLTGFANFSYQELGQTFGVTENVRRGLPRFKYNIGLRGDLDNGINWETALHHYGSATYPMFGAFQDFAAFGVPQPDPRVGSYNLLNMRAGYRFWQQKAAAGYMRDAEVAVSVFNALNDEHKEHPLGDLIGRRVMGWLTVRF